MHHVKFERVLVGLMLLIIVSVCGVAAYTIPIDSDVVQGVPVNVYFDRFCANNDCVKLGDRPVSIDVLNDNGATIRFFYSKGVLTSKKVH